MNERLIPLLKTEGLEKLKNSCVAVIGIGGVGGEVVIALARSGIGKIIIQDYDKVEISNINRQYVADYTTIGKYKVDVMEKKIKDINPDCQVIKLNSFFDEDHNDVITFKVDFLIDCIDNIESKISLINQCLKEKINFISSMGAAKKIDPTKVAVMPLNKTSYDPVAKILRNKLKNTKIMTVSSVEAPQCTELGSYMPVVATFGLLLADYVIKMIVAQI